MLTAPQFSPAALQSVRARILRAAESAARDPGSVRLLAVSKQQPAALVRAAAAAGQTDFGENYVQEGIDKVAALADATQQLLERTKAAGELRPEIAQTYEAGVNFRFSDLAKQGDRLGAKIGVFENNVEDYIDQVFILFPIPGGYQYQNISQARIRGVEVEGSYDSGDIFASISGQYLDGQNLTTGGELQKVPPLPQRATAEPSGVRPRW